MSHEHKTVFLLLWVTFYCWVGGAGRTNNEGMGKMIFGEGSGRSWGNGCFC